MSETYNSEINIKILGSVNTLEYGERKSGYYYRENLATENAHSVYKKLLAEAEGEIVYVNATSPLSDEIDILFVKVMSGSIDVRFEAGGTWVTIPNVIVIEGKNIEYLGIRATPDGGAGKAEYNLITAEESV